MLDRAAWAEDNVLRYCYGKTCPRCLACKNKSPRGKRWTSVKRKTHGRDFRRALFAWFLRNPRGDHLLPLLRLIGGHMAEDHPLATRAPPPTRPRGGRAARPWQTPIRSWGLQGFRGRGAVGGGGTSRSRLPSQARLARRSVGS